MADAIRYSALLARHPDRLIILVALMILPAINLIVLGYLARVIRETPLSAQLPRVNRWSEMVADGLRLLAVSLCYLIAGVVMIVLLYIAGSWPLAIIGLAALFVGFILLPVALVHSVKTGNPVNGLDVREIVRRVSVIGWVDYLALATAEFLLVTVVMVAVISIPVVGFLGGLVLSPGIGVFLARASAMACS